MYQTHLDPKKLLQQVSLKVPAYSLLAGAVVMLFFVLVLNAFSTHQSNYINRLTSSSANSVNDLVHQDINNRISVLRRLAIQGPNETVIVGENWHNTVKNIVLADPGYQAIMWADHLLNIKRVESINGSEITEKLNLVSRINILEAARDSKKVFISEPINLLQGVKVMVIIVPIYRESDFNGLMIGVLDLDIWLDSILPSFHSSEIFVSVGFNGTYISTRDQDKRVTDPSLGTEISSDLLNLKLNVSAIPNPEFLTLVATNYFYTLLVAALLISLLVTISVFLALNLFLRTKVIKDTSKYLEALFESLPGISYLSATSYPWPMDFVSDGCKKLCGYHKEEIEGLKINWGELIHPDDRHHVQKLINEAIEGNKSFEFEYRIRTRCGIEKWMWERGVAVSSGDNNELMLEGFITDISDRKRSESKWMEVRSYSEAIVDAAIEAIITMGANNRIISFNREAQVIFGYTMEEAIGQKIHILLPESYHQEHNKYIKHFNDTGELKYLFARREMQLLRKDSSEFPAQVSVNKMEYQKERCFVCLVRDISTERVAQQVARDQREQLAHVDRLNILGEMASGIAHEINQPLTAISLFSTSGKQFMEKAQFARLPEIFDKLTKHALRAGAVIERMQDMSRRHNNDKERIDCNILINEIVAFAESDARIRDITIVTEFGEDIPQVMVDKVQIQQVALNLLRNGMEAMVSSSNESAKKILIRTYKNSNDEIEVAVIDSGMGVSKETAKKLFEPFSTTKSAGMGMGLAISKAIIAAHGGQLNYYNNEFVGATFYFTLPQINLGA